jgi:hypothetical protein
VYAVLNERAPDGFEVVSFRPQVHPLFEPWLEVLDTAMPIRQFVDFLIGNRRQVIYPDAKALVMDLAQVKLSRNVELMQGFGKHSINGIKITTDIAGEAKGVSIELPDTITINVPLYVAQTYQDVDIDLVIDGTEKTGVMVTLKSADAATSRVGAFEQFVRDMKESLGETYTIGLGTPKHGTWATLPAR